MKLEFTVLRTTVNFRQSLAREKLAAARLRRFCCQFCTSNGYFYFRTSPKMSSTQAVTVSDAGPVRDSLKHAEWLKIKARGSARSSKRSLSRMINSNALASASAFVLPVTVSNGDTARLSCEK